MVGVVWPDETRARAGSQNSTSLRCPQQQPWARLLPAPSFQEHRESLFSKWFPMVGSRGACWACSNPEQPPDMKPLSSPSCPELCRVLWSPPTVTSILLNDVRLAWPSWYNLSNSHLSPLLGNQFCLARVQLKSPSV